MIGTGIAWCDDTFNLWWGCVEHGPGCLHCYAREWAKRCGLDVWGVDKPRRFFDAKHWRELDAIQRLAITGERPKPTEAEPDAAFIVPPLHSRRVFVGSMMDIAEGRDDERPVVAEFWRRARRCTWIDFLCLTKRPEKYREILPPDWGATGYPNVWLLASAVTQAEVDRNARALEGVPAVVKGMSLEPQIEELRTRGMPHIRWRITGGESGGRDKVRLYKPAWAERVIEDADADGAAAFVKQMGTLWAYGNKVLSKKADVPSEWPVELRVQRHPMPRRTSPVDPSTFPHLEAA